MIISKFYEGMVLNQKVADTMAKKLLKRSKVGTNLILGFYNGIDVYIKTSKNKIRVSTQKEYKKIMTIQNQKSQEVKIK